MPRLTAKNWADALTPLGDVIAELVLGWLPRQAYPVRHGVHPNSAFALALLLEAYVDLRRPDGSLLADLGQNISGWVRLSYLGPPGTTLTLRHGEHVGPDGELTTSHLDVDFPMFP